MIFNISGVFITKITSALTRGIVDCLRAISVWMIGIIVTLNSSRDWENNNGYAVAL